MSNIEEEVGGASQSSKAVGVGGVSAQPESTATSSDLKVLYSDDDIAVLDKPPGLRTVPGAGKPTEGSESANRALVRKGDHAYRCCGT